MTQLFTILLILSHFIADLPNLDDVENMSKKDLVKKYSSACLGFFNKPEFQGYNPSQLVQSILQSLNSNPAEMEWLEGKGRSQDILQFYEKICKNNPDLKVLDNLDEDLKGGGEEYKTIMTELPEVKNIRRLSLPQSIDLISSDDAIIADISAESARRKSVRLQDLPPYIPAIFVAVEDSRFFQHRGLDELSIIRALMKDMTKSGGRQGASTISQQVARNLYLTLKPTMRRKLEEILIAEKIEKQLSKKEILEIYLNLIYFGRNAWGIEKASQSYFSKHAKNLTPIEAAFLAGVVHGPNLYRDRPDRVEKRLEFVLSKTDDAKSDMIKNLKISPEIDYYNSGFLRDYTLDEIKNLNISQPIQGGQIKTHINSKMQVIASEALQEGLINYEKRMGGYWVKPLHNIQDEINQNAILLETTKEMRKIEQEKTQESLFSSIDAGSPIYEPLTLKPWVAPLNELVRKFPLPNKNWKLAVLLSNDGRIGLNNDTEGTLSSQNLASRAMKPGDVFYVQPSTRLKTKSSAKDIWELVKPPHINGGAIVMNTSGEILAMVGGFSYSLSKWNRATQAVRQPGSLLKPFTYLTALQKGIQPNTLLSDHPITFPPLFRGGRSWTPENYGDGETLGSRPMRWALENSRNIMTVHLMTKTGLNPIRKLTEDFGLYNQADKYYPFILGSQETNLLSLVKAYGEIANGGYYITPQIIDQITEPYVPVPKQTPNVKVVGVDDISVFQLRYLLQGVVARGTAAQINKFSKVVAGKTGTTNDSKDVWFIGFTSNLIIGVYVGYDNPATLGSESTGSAIALPIFERILTESIRTLHLLPEAFPPPPPGVVFHPTNRITGEIVSTMSHDTILEAYRESVLQKEIK